MRRNGKVWVSGSQTGSCVRTKALRALKQESSFALCSSEPVRRPETLIHENSWRPVTLSSSKDKHKKKIFHCILICPTIYEAWANLAGLIHWQTEPKCKKRAAAKPMSKRAQSWAEPKTALKEKNNLLGTVYGRIKGTHYLKTRAKLG